MNNNRTTEKDLDKIIYEYGDKIIIVHERFDVRAQALVKTGKFEMETVKIPEKPGKASFLIDDKGFVQFIAPYRGVTHCVILNDEGEKIVHSISLCSWLDTFEKYTGRVKSKGRAVSELMKCYTKRDEAVGSGTGISEATTST